MEKLKNFCTLQKSKSCAIQKRQISKSYSYITQNLRHYAQSDNDNFVIKSLSILKFDLYLMTQVSLKANKNG